MNKKSECNKHTKMYKDLKIENKNKLTRNGFLCVGDYDMPLIRGQNINLENIKLISFSNTKHNDLQNKNKTVHFFIDDYRFDYVYNRPILAAEKLKQYYCLLSPDFSLYTDMPLALQIKNTFKNRWCGAYWQSLGINVIPTISWSDNKSFEFCFDGVEKYSIVAISTLGSKKAKEEFMLGYNKMLEILEPSAIICYDKPFAEMKGNLIVFPYRNFTQSEVTYEN